MPVHRAPGACHKQRFVQRAHAVRALDRIIRAESLDDPGSLAVYRCPYCAGFHVGHDRRPVMPPTPSARVPDHPHQGIAPTWEHVDYPVIYVKPEGRSFAHPEPWLCRLGWIACVHTLVGVQFYSERDGQRRLRINWCHPRTLRWFGAPAHPEFRAEQAEKLVRETT